MKRYPGVQQLAPWLVGDGLDLESRLREFANSSAHRVVRHFKEVAPYLRDIIWDSSNNYVSSPAAYSALVQNLLHGNQHEVLVLSTNYDTLVEQALRLWNSDTYAFTRSADYCAERPLRLVKTYECLNWLRAMPVADIWNQDFAMFDPVAPSDSLEVSDVGPSIRGAKARNRWVYPIVTAPLAGKDQSALVCPPDHVIAAQEFLKTCHRILVVGTKGIDDDITSLLARSLPDSGLFQIAVVSLNEAQQTWKNFQTRIPQSRHITTNSQFFSHYDGGLASYVTGSKFDAFLTP